MNMNNAPDKWLLFNQKKERHTNSALINPLLCCFFSYSSQNIEPSLFLLYNQQCIPINIGSEINGYKSYPDVNRKRYA